MPGELSRAAAIVGAAEANEIGYPEVPKTSLQLHIEAIKNVSDQTGIPISAIDGVFSAGEDRPEHSVRAAVIADPEGHYIELVGPMSVG